MEEISVIIPNYNGIKYISDCLDHLLTQTEGVHIIVVDNGSTDGSVDIIRRYADVELIELGENFGFCRAVNEGIKRAETKYVLLLNNDTKADPDMAKQLRKVMEKHPGTFSVAAKMLQMNAPDRIDSAGDLFCALGWAFSLGKDAPAERYDREAVIFSACAGAALYDTGILRDMGYFDERCVSYLEDVDVGYRARIRGLSNRYAPKALVYHAGSATTGSRHNAYKVKQAARNSVYLIYKNMPAVQLILNLPFLVAGSVIKALYFACKGLGGRYISGVMSGCRICRKEYKTAFEAKYLPNYIRIQLELWINMFRRITG